MFNINPRVTTHNGDGIDSPSYLLDHTGNSLVESLGGDAIPDFSLELSKTDGIGLPSFDHLDLYGQYTESGPSSVQPGDSYDASERGGSHMSAKDEAEIALHDTDAWFGKSESKNDSVHSHIRDTPSDNRRHGMETLAGNNNRISPVQRVLFKASTLSEEDTQECSIQTRGPQDLGKSTKHSDPTLIFAEGVLSTPSTSQVEGRSRNSAHTPSEQSPRRPPLVFRARSSIPTFLPPVEFARQCVLAAESSRLNPFALHIGEYKLLREHITRSQITIYLNIRNAILRIWTRNPLVSVTQGEAAGCARDGRYFQLAQIAHEWLMRHGYINHGCVEVSNTAGTISRSRARGGKRRCIVVIGAGVSGLGCARQLEGLIAQLGERWTSDGEKPPRVIVLEGRGRIGGRVYSHRLKRQAAGLLPQGLSNTAEMGAQIITGFERGNPLNTIVRGQLGLHYHRLKDDTVIYDSDGAVVDKNRDELVFKLFNDILDRACAFRNKTTPQQTVEGDAMLIQTGRDPYNEGEPVLSQLEEAGTSVAVAASAQTGSKRNASEYLPIAVEKLAGRAYQLAKAPSNMPAAAAVQQMGWQLRPGAAPHHSINMAPVGWTCSQPTLGDTMDDAIMQYRNILNLAPLDMRLLNWHHANLEYANAANLNQLSLGGWDMDIGNEFEGEHTEVIGGYTQVPCGLWQHPTKLDIRFNTPVREIKYSTEKAGRVAIECETGESFEADRVVVTTPLGVLKAGSVIFEPPLPEWKRGAIDRLGFGLLNKAGTRDLLHCSFVDAECRLSSCTRSLSGKRIVT